VLESGVAADLGRLVDHGFAAGPSLASGIA
jgi:hypothetical protein